MKTAFQKKKEAKQQAALELHKTKAYPTASAPVGPGASGLMTKSKIERLRLQYRPERITVLFVGEAPPASDTFFYRGNSGLTNYMRDALGGPKGDVEVLVGSRRVLLYRPEHGKPCKCLPLFTSGVSARLARRAVNSLRNLASTGHACYMVGDGKRCPRQPLSTFLMESAVIA